MRRAFLAGLVLLVCGWPALGCTSQETVTLAWTSPVDGSEVFGLVRLTVRASAALRDAQVVFYAGDTLLERVEPLDVRDYPAVWDTTASANEPLTLRAVLTYRENDQERTLETSISVQVRNITRAESIPAGAVKMTPASDPTPPRLNPAVAGEWQAPVPLPGPINTAGAEDSPFITLDGREFYFFFTPDASIPAEQQLGDRVTGIYRAEWVPETAAWSEPQRVWLSFFDELSLDGAPTVAPDPAGDTLWFASARVRNFRGVDMWTARREDAGWRGWTNVGQRLNQQVEIGELHVTADGRTVVFDSYRADGQGEKDIWQMHLDDAGEWGAPEPVLAVNSALMEGWPFVSADGSELWFTRWHQGAPAIFRSTRTAAGDWGAPGLIVSMFAGEPTLDRAGNLYFVHHYIRDGAILEADIYVAYRR